MQDTLKDIFGPMFEAMLQGEIVISATKTTTEDTKTPVIVEMDIAIKP